MAMTDVEVEALTSLVAMAVLVWVVMMLLMENKNALLLEEAGRWKKSGRLFSFALLFIVPPNGTGFQAGDCDPAHERKSIEL